jgi:hypothetical protein
MYEGQTYHHETRILNEYNVRRLLGFIEVRLS